MKYLLLALLLLTGCSKKKEELSSPIPVATTRPTIKEASFCVRSLGTLAPFTQAQIFPDDEGDIISVWVQEGQDVKKDDPLFLIDATLQTIQVQKARAQLAEAKAEEEALQKKLDRYKSLSKKDLVSKSDLEELEANGEKAKQTVLLSELALQEAELNLQWCTIRAPISGRVGKISCSKGVSVTKETLLTTITQLDPLIIETRLTEKEFSLVRSRKRIIVSPLYCKEVKKEGMITFFDAAFDEKKGTLLVRGRLPNNSPESMLVPGQAVAVEIPYRVEEKALHIPQSAISYNQDGPYVYTVKEGATAEVCQLTLGEEAGDERIVEKGLNPESEIIVESVPRLFPGCTVKVVP